MTSPYVYLGQGRFEGGPWDDSVIPSEQATFDNLSEHIQHKAERQQFFSTGHRRAYSWKYDHPEIQEGLHSGAYQVDPSTLYSDTLKWMDDASVVYLRGLDGESVGVLASKRGNYAFASRYKKKFRALDKIMMGFEWSRPLSNHSDDQLCFALLITPTFDRTDLTIQEAWESLTSEIAKLRYVLGRDLWASVASITVKEGTKSGYPAPHILIIFDRPILCYRHVSTHKSHPGRVTYRIKNERLWLKLKSRWHHGHVDIQGVVQGDVVDLDHNTVMSAPKYLFKYLIKAVQVDGTAPIESNIPLTTTAWQKLFRLRPIHVSKSFKVRFGRLDTIISQSQQQKSLVSPYLTKIPCKLSEYLQVLMSPPPPGPHAPWYKGEIRMDSR
jgi:hypothetical protein